MNLLVALLADEQSLSMAHRQPHTLPLVSHNHPCPAVARRAFIVVADTINLR